MFSLICFILAIIFLVVAIISGSTQSILALGISSMIASLSFILSILTIKIQSINKHIRKEAKDPRIIWIFKTILLSMGVAFLLISYLFVTDIPNYLNKNYEKIEGVPTKIEYVSPSRTGSGGIDIAIDNQLFRLNSLNYEIDEVKERRFVIYYLPNTKWVMDYEIKGSNDKDKDDRNG